MLKANIDSSITSLSKMHLFNKFNFPSEVYTVVQLNNGTILEGLGNGSIYFFMNDNLINPSNILNVDKFPITNIIQLENNSIICSSNSPSLFIIKENPQIKNEYEIIKKKNTKSYPQQNINKIIELPNENLIYIDNYFITMTKNDLSLIKEKKINSPIIDIILINKKTVVCALPAKKSIIYFETEKLNQEKEIKNIKFLQTVDFNNIFCILNHELLFVGGCLGCIYLISLKNTNFIAHLNLVNNREIITSVYNLKNGDLACGVSIVEDINDKVVGVISDLVQFEYKEYQNSFQEIHRLKKLHSNIIRVVKEIINHKGMKILISASLDGTTHFFNL